MNPTEFERWCQTLKLPAATVESIAKIRSAPPSRRVQGRASNVSGTYPSQKMGLTIQFEKIGRAPRLNSSHPSISRMPSSA